MQTPFQPIAKYIGTKGNVGASDTTILDGGPGLADLLGGGYAFYAVSGVLADNANDKRFRLKSDSTVILDTGANLNGVADKGFKLLVESKVDGLIRIEFRLNIDDYVNSVVVANFPTSVVLNGEADDDIVVNGVTAWALAADIPDTQFDIIR